MSAPALNVYRGLLRSASAAFKGDATMLSAAQQEIRAKFEVRQTLPALPTPSAATLPAAAHAILPAHACRSRGM